MCQARASQNRGVQATVEEGLVRAVAEQEPHSDQGVFSGWECMLCCSDCASCNSRQLVEDVDVRLVSICIPSPVGKSDVIFHILVGALGGLSAAVKQSALV